MCTVVERNLGLSRFARISLPDWLVQVRESDDCPDSLMDFFQNYFITMSGGQLVLDTASSRAVSRTLRSAGAVAPGTVEKYLNFWFETPLTSPVNGTTKNGG